MFYKPLCLFVSVMLSLPLWCQTANRDEKTSEQVIAAINDLNGEGKYSEAISVAQQAITNSTFNCIENLGLYRKMGVSYYLADDFDNALRFWRDTIIIGWENCEVSTIQKIKVYSNISAVYDYLDQKDKYFEYFEKVLELNNSLDQIDTFTTVQNYIRAGTYFSSINDYDKAKTYFEEGLLFFNENYSDPASFVLLQSRYGYSALQSKKFNKALSHFNAALENDSQATQLSDESKLSIFINMSIAHLRLGQLTPAELYLDKASSFLSDDNVDLYTSILFLEAEILFLKGDTSDYVIQIFDEIIGLSQDKANRTNLGVAYGNKAEFLVKNNRLEDGRLTLKLGLESISSEPIPTSIFDLKLTRESILKSTSLLWLFSVGVQLEEAEFIHNRDSIHLINLLGYVDKIDELIRKGRMEISSEQSAINTLKKVYPALESGIGAAVQLHSITGNVSYLEKAYSLANRNKAIVLRENLVKLDLSRKFIPAVEFEKLKAYESDITTQKIALQNEVDKEKRDSISKEFFKVLEEQDIFLAGLKSEYPKYFSITQQDISAVNSAMIQQKLRLDQGLVEYFIGDSNLYLFLISKNSFQVNVKSIDSSFLSQIKTKVLGLKSAGTIMDNELYETLIQPFVKTLTAEHIKRLIFIPDGVLNALPFESLKNSTGHYLIEDFSVSYNFSNSFLLGSQPFEKPKKGYIGYGTQYSDSISKNIAEFYPVLKNVGLSNLSNSKNEVSSFRKILGGNSVLGELATKENFKQNDNSATVLHLALHGISYGVNNSHSSILFDDHQDGDFALDAQEIYGLDLNTSLLLLSVCQSADGEIFRGEGIQSMSRAFFFAGAQSIVSSLWTASEQPAEEILGYFLSEIKSGEPKDIALQNAKLRYFEQARPSLRHETYWANFILIGDAEPVSFNSGIKYYLILLGFLLLAVILYFIAKHFNGKKT